MRVNCLKRSSGKVSQAAGHVSPARSAHPCLVISLLSLSLLVSKQMPESSSSREALWLGVTGRPAFRDAISVREHPSITGAWDCTFLTSNPTPLSLSLSYSGSCVRSPVPPLLTTPARSLPSKGRIDHQRTQTDL